MKGSCLKFLAHYTRPYLGCLILTALAGAGCSAANVEIIDLLRQVIDQAIPGEEAVPWPQLALRAVIVIALGILANYLVVAMTGFLGAGVLRDLRRDLAAHIMKIDPDFMERHNYGDIMERLSSDVAGIAEYIQRYFKDCLYVPILVIAFALYLFSRNAILALACLGPLALMVPLSIRLLRPVKVAQASYVKLLGLTNNHILEAFDGAETIKAYGLQDKMAEKYRAALEEPLDISNRNDLRQYHIEPLSRLINEAPTAAALCLGGALALGGDITLGLLVAFISGIQRINEPLVGAYQLVIRTQMALISVRRAFEILEMPTETAPEKSVTPNFSQEKAFTLENVCFSYFSRKGNPALGHLNLTIEKGTRLALTGPSGSGKSTLLKLLCRQYEADSGTISFFQCSFADLHPQSLRQSIALISQDAVLFPMSVSDNIRIGRPEASPGEIKEAARKAGCHEFISRLPQGYDTLLQERGSDLSGGQRQRISIARAILKDAPVLLLDEPTSALDRETERQLCETLRIVSQGKTVVTAAHRLATIEDYDEILVLREGQIIERGTHDFLMAAEGMYCRMYREPMAAGGAEQ